MEFNNAEITDGRLGIDKPHEVFIFDYELGASSKGNQFVRFTFKKNEKERHIEDFYTSFEYKFKQLSIAAGIDKDAKWELEDLKGKKVTLYLKKESYNEKDYTKISRIEPPANPEDNKVDPLSKGANDPY